jgi:hypothetical protein
MRQCCPCVRRHMLWHWHLPPYEVAGVGWQPCRSQGPRVATSAVRHMLGLGRHRVTAAFSHSALRRPALSSRLSARRAYCSAAVRFSCQRFTVPAAPHKCSHSLIHSVHAGTCPVGQVSLKWHSLTSRKGVTHVAVLSTGRSILPHKWLLASV